MGKVSTVEIPEGSGNLYRYEYQDGKTEYLGPIGSAPELNEQEFMAELLLGQPVKTTDIEHSLRAKIGDYTEKMWESSVEVPVYVDGVGISLKKEGDPSAKSYFDRKDRWEQFDVAITETDEGYIVYTIQDVPYEEPQVHERGFPKGTPLDVMTDEMVKQIEGMGIILKTKRKD